MLSGRGLAQAIRQWGLVTGTGASGLALGFAADIEKSVGGSLTREMRGESGQPSAEGKPANA